MKSPSFRHPSPLRAEVSPPPPLSDRIALIKQVAAFSKLPGKTLKRLAAKLEGRHFSPGARILKEGEKGGELYLIIEGKVGVTVLTPGGEETLSTLERGQTFGELALLQPDHCRQATVTALVSTHVLVFKESILAELLSTQRQTRQAIVKAARVMATEKFLKVATPFTRLNTDRIHWLAERLCARSIPKGTKIIEQGKLGEECFLLRTGSVEVVVSDAAEAPHRVTILGAGSLFGEAALLTESARSATVKTVEDCELLVLHRADLLEAIRGDRTVGAELVQLLQVRDRPKQVPGTLAVPMPSSEGEPMVVLKDAVNHRYYRLSARGWFLWQRLNGEKNLRDLTLDYFDAFETFAPFQVAETIAGLVRAGFVTMRGVRPDVMAALTAMSPGERLIARILWLLQWRWAIGGVDAVLTRVHSKVVRHLVGVVPQAALALIGVTGLLLFLSRGLESCFTPDAPRLQWIGLLPIYAAVVLFHEAGHALAVKAFGREVPAVGIGWHWISPIAFVDTSDMWLAQKWQRLVVNAAGPYINFVMAGLAAWSAILFGGTSWENGMWHFALVSYVIVLLNLSPILDLDGYHFLMDYFGEPNLRQKATAYWSSRIRGKKEDPAPSPSRVPLLYTFLTLGYLGALMALASAAFLHFRS